MTKLYPPWPLCMSLLAGLAVAWMPATATNQVTLGNGGDDSVPDGTGGESSTAGSGGDPGMGGQPGAGGATGASVGGATGGASTASGGSRATGGATTAGGAPGSGGSSYRGATGGTTGTGGASTAAALSTKAIKLAGKQILDCTGKPVVARGVEAVLASTAETKVVDQVAALGANAMRMLFTLDATNNMTPDGFDALLARAVSHRMLVWVSLYTWDNAKSNAIADALGGGNFYSLAAPVGTACSKSTPSSCYLAVWNRPWLKDLMKKYRSHVIIDASQEFIGTGDASSAAGRASWAAEAKVNIKFFRDQGYTNPLEVMANFQGRDLYGIVEHGDAIRAVDTITVDGEPQTMFGWQAYWGTADGYYPSYQGPLLLGRAGAVLSGVEAIHQFAATRTFPIQIGMDNFSGDTNLDYKAQIDQAAADGMSWLWWSWRDGQLDCPASGSTCRDYLTTSTNAFKGATPLTE